jgi:hypothetical protein
MAMIWNDPIRPGNVGAMGLSQGGVRPSRFIGASGLGTIPPASGGLEGLGGSGASGGPFIDPKTGKMLRAPTTTEEMAQAEMEARNAALAGQERSVEAAINKGTEEITQSEMEAKRQAGQSSAAAGVTNAADMQGGLQALGSAYSGQRANLARDVRARQQDQQRSEDASMFGRIAGYQQAAYGQSQDSTAAAKAMGGSSSTFTGPRASKAAPDNVFAKLGQPSAVKPGVERGAVNPAAKGFRPEIAKKYGAMAGW